MRESCNSLRASRSNNEVPATPVPRRMQTAIGEITVPLSSGNVATTVYFLLVAPAENVTLPSSCSIIALLLIVPVFLMRILHSPVMLSFITRRVKAFRSSRSD